MTITAYDSLNDFFVIENFYPRELINEFVTTDHLTAPWKKEDWQDEYPRRRLIHEPGSIYEKFDLYTKSQIDTVSRAIGLDLMTVDTGFWLDEAGFCMDPHLDNAKVAVSMQIYLNDNNSNLGTVFYNPDNTIRCASEYKVNTGYLMINGPDQLHGMGNPVPRGTYRISSYSWFCLKV